MTGPVQEIELRCQGLQELRSFVDTAGQGGVWLLPPFERAGLLGQFERLRLHVILPDASGALDVEVLQVLPDGAVVVRLLDPGLVDTLLAGVAPADAPRPPAIGWRAADAAMAAAHAAAPQDPARDQAPTVDPALAHDGEPVAVTGPAAWPIEKLLQEWVNLSVPDRILVAKRGQLAARRHVLKQQDRTLHGFVLVNPGLTAEEVAAMAGMTALDPELLKRIAGKVEWLRHSSVVRNLICNPKLPLDLVERLLGKLPEPELRKLAKTGRVRDAVKRLIIARVSGRG